jgi:PPOX class probable F420-dependent enzyme
MPISDEQTILLTTFRKSGEPVSTPVWVIDLGDNQVGFWTSSVTGKVKRLAHTPRVTVQPCSNSGKVKAGSAVVEGTARVVRGDELEAIRAKVVAKYGFWTKITKVLAKIVNGLRGKRFPYADRGIVITLSS